MTTTPVEQAISERLFAEAVNLLPGGVSSPVRAFRGVGGTPRFMARGEGAWLIDVDDRRYVDLVLSWGPLILGHAHADVLRAIHQAAAWGTTYGAPTEIELELARRIIEQIPSIELIRFVSSGTEAAMSAVRLARAATGRRRIVKFEGCYHGHADPLLAAAGSGVATLGLPDSPGVPEAAVADTITLPFNDLAAVEECFHRQGETIAAIIVEPVPGNMGVVPPGPGFLSGLRDLTSRFGTLLIFDEVMTGWRVHPQAAQVLYGIRPDLTCLGKVMGGGLPAAAFGGRRDIMELLAPLGPVYQAGTLSGNPLAMTAGLATLDALERTGVWQSAESFAEQAVSVLSEAAAASGVPVAVQRVGTMFTVFFTSGPVRNYQDVRATDRARYARFFHAMLEAGVYLPPSAFEAAFTSSAHGDVELQVFSEAVRAGFRSLRAE
ncbi:MAG TPA: glutamate-1-semialdehyde 2,1-aminomutase [Gemmatimonadales bacterium]|nr:glutamate-1-semialdehyde 2,1-aminomutase [Gemmatimonadales bacterium]